MGTNNNGLKSVIDRAPSAWQGVPRRLKVLYISAPMRTGGWLAEALAADSATQVLLAEASGEMAGMARLRDEVFDAILISHEPGTLDALGLVEGYRTGGAEEPIIVLGSESEADLAVQCYEAGADGYVCVQSTTTRNFIWTLGRAVQRHELISENQRFHLAERSRMQREQEESRRLLAEQQAFIVNFERIAPGVKSVELPSELIAHYRELLRTYVIMGSGNLSEELQQLARMLVRAGISAGQTMELHLGVLEEMVQGLGARSTRHVMARADLLVLEVMTGLGEGYRHESLETSSQLRYEAALETSPLTRLA
jgi:DNA-binding NarL/FixJ family response regulator